MFNSVSVRQGTIALISCPVILREFFMNALHVRIAVGFRKDAGGGNIG